MRNKHSVLLTAIFLFIAIAAVASAATSPRYQTSLQRQETKFLMASASASEGCASASNPIVNCGFETADFTGWEVEDVATPFFPLSVDSAGIDLGLGAFVSAPSEGTYAALHGFDGDGPDTIRLSQDVLIPSSAQELRFDYRAGWDLATFGASEDRSFEVQIQPAGGGTPLRRVEFLRASAGTVRPDTGLQQGRLSIQDFAGQNVRISFEWSVPENLSGPGLFQLDNISVGEASAVPIPTLDSIGLVLMVALLAGAAAILLRRRRETAESTKPRR